MLLSIIIPTYNSTATLKKSLDSIANQLFEDYELIVIDGNSSDGTVDTIKQYNSIVQNFKWISEPDKGIYDAMNKGIKMASGEWLYFLGSNDYLINEYVLDNVFNVVKVEKPDFVYGNVIWGHFNTFFRGKIYLKDLYFMNICHQSIFSKKEIILKHGCFNTNYTSFADWDMNFKIFKDRSIKIMYVDQLIAFFDLTGTSGGNKDAFESSMYPLIKKYFSFKNRVLLFLSNKIRSLSEYLIPKK